MREHPLYHEPLEWSHCVDLSERLAEGDRMECFAMAHTPLQALSSGIMTGHAMAALRKGPGDVCAGAFGWTYQGTIWSLWAADLTTQEKLQVLRQTPQWVREFVLASGRDYLWNYVSMDNHTGVAWLRASRCFYVEEEPRLILPPTHFAYFQTLPHLANRAA